MKLLLEDGTEIEGESFGAAKAVAGEVVFNTGMTGYVETLTDPSYRGQILVCTPRAAGTLEGPYESDRIQVQGLVVQHYHAAYSHATAARSLGEWLQSEEIPAISGADTRALTRKIRENGTMKGWLLPNGATGDQARNSADEVVMSQVFDLVAPGETKTYPAGSLTVLLVDVGAKDNIVRAMLARDVTVVRASWRADLAQLARQADGVLIGNGPGDPKDLGPLIDQLSALMVDYDKPIFGVCLGHQILALAAGGDTYKLKYGHRGVNQPVQDLLTRRCYVTSQNHGYAVRDESLPEAWEPWFINLNDQFHPEAAPGPEDTGALFDDFVRLMGAMRRA
jgi:carbamoyl-phosphate synthase small subunit